MVANIPGIDDEEKYVYEISKSSYLPPSVDFRRKTLFLTSVFLSLSILFYNLTLTIVYSP